MPRHSLVRRHCDSRGRRAGVVGLFTLWLVSLSIERDNRESMDLENMQSSWICVCARAYINISLCIYVYVCVMYVYMCMYVYIFVIVFIFVCMCNVHTYV